MKRWHLYFVVWRSERVNGTGWFGCIFHRLKGPLSSIPDIIEMVDFIKESNGLTSTPIITGITLLKKSWFRKAVTVGKEWSDE